MVAKAVAEGKHPKMQPAAGGDANDVLQHGRVG